MIQTGSNSSIPSRQLEQNYPKSLRFDTETASTDMSSMESNQQNGGRLRGPKTVVLLKILVIFILVAAALLLSFLAYYLITKDEDGDFQAQFSGFAVKIMEQFLDVTHLRVWTCYSLSLSYITEFEGSNSWPAVTLPRFAVKTFGTVSMARASAIAFSPLVTAITRTGWETYAAQNDPQLDLNDTLASAQPRSALPTGNSYNTADGIYRIDKDTTVPDGGPEPFFPIWQISPINGNAQAVMFNQMSDPSRAQALSVMAKSNHPVHSEVFYQDTFDQKRDEGDFETRGVLYFPVFDAFVKGSVVGAVSLEFNWEDTFRQALPGHTKGIVVVLENTLGQQFTYNIVGEDVVFLGTGDLHDTKYDYMEELTSYADFLATYDAAALFSSSEQNVEESAIAEGARSRRLEEDGCLYAVRVYPSSELESLYVTSALIYYSAFVVIIFALTSIVFILYDCFVQRRQNEVMTTAARANAIIDSLFPAMVRERVFQTNENRAKAQVGQDSKNSGQDRSSAKHPRRGSMGQGDTPKKRLKLFFSRNEFYSTVKDLDPMQDPIADLFPESTIMFADIAGFTAWSSEREPSQVFQLLESVYFAFDEVAKQMGVFKLETIGDCYVAATGLPEPNKEHAVVMTRFAFECLHRMQQVSRELEISLGPGTSDLAIRVGLHSGPVTGGVLRGEKSRFQLFGDTMNTAARMESNGQRGMIQISQATADLLVQAGKNHWLTPREDVVIAKGKGEMKTFWIMPRNMSEEHAEEMSTVEESSVASMRSHTSASTRGSKASAVDPSFRVTFRRRRSGLTSTRWGSMSLLEDTIGVKNARLVDWNVDVLLSLLTRVVAQREGCLPSSGGDTTQLSPVVRDQLHDYVAKIESLYRDIPYHNFEHASHVSMSVNKLMKRIVDQEGSAEDIKRRTFGISDDPLVHFAVVFSALIIDVDHRGVPNEQLVKERDGLAVKYKNKSVAEQHSIKLAWETLKNDSFSDLRECIYRDDAERYRFRQLVANAVMATDIKEPKLQAVRKKRWNSVFRSSNTSASDSSEDVEDRKAKLVIEHVMQAANVAHTMQHWSIFIKWNECLYLEMFQAYRSGRADEDPSVYWYEDDLRFFDNHVIPLAKKLKECGVFGDSGDEYFTLAEQNRQEWDLKGRDICRRRIEKATGNERMIDGS